MSSISVLIAKQSSYSFMTYYTYVSAHVEYIEMQYLSIISTCHEGLEDMKRVPSTLPQSASQCCTINAFCSFMLNNRWIFNSLTPGGSPTCMFLKVSFKLWHSVGHSLVKERSQVSQISHADCQQQ